MISAALDRRARVEHDERHPDLAEAFVGDADHRDLRDPRVPQQQVLDLGRVRVEAADDEHVLDAPDDAQVAVGVERAEVAGVQPSVGVDRGRGRFGVVEVAARSPSRRAPRPRRARPARCRRRARSTVRTSKPVHGTPTVVAMCSKSSSGLLPVTVPASVSP